MVATRARRSGRRVHLLAVAIALTGVACRSAPPPADTALDAAARRYVELVADLTLRDPDSASGDTAAVAEPNGTPRSPRSFAAIAADARATYERLEGAPLESGSESESDRRDWLLAHLDAVAARASQSGGTALTFDQELARLFGVTRPADTRDRLAPVRARIDQRLPGRGTTAARLDAFETRVVVPADRLPAVFASALEACRVRTAARVSLPPGDAIEVEYVTGRPWSAFSTYLGHARSRISVNTSFPLTVDRVLALACHEGYPGHHVLNSARDARRRNGRPELAALPLFSPESFATEAVASTAASLVFTDDERLAFERDVLVPLAGLSAGDAARHLEVARLLDRLAPAISGALAAYLAGERDYVETLWALQADALMQHPQATLGFANQFRGVSLAYTWLASGPSGVDEGDAGADAAWRRYEALRAGDYRNRMRKSPL
jgi:hypothetical protein